ncbi:MAG: methylenetetrahydrofolate reductase [Desulfobacterales bacterium]
MHLKSKFESGQFVVMVEFVPPKGTDVSLMVSNAIQIKGRVDAYMIADMPNGVMRMSALCGAMILQSKGLETLMQVSCRDRNRLAIQADLLGANACGVGNLVAVTGDDPSFGDHHEALAVYDIDTLDLLYGIQCLQKGRDMAGGFLDGIPQFLTGSTVNPCLKGQALELELEKMNRRVEAGARFFVTPPIFDLTAIEPFLARIDHRKHRIIPTVLLLKSLGMARYIERHQKHIRIPSTLIRRIQTAEDKSRECLRMAGELILALRDEQFSGVAISAAGWEHRIPELLDSVTVH